MDILLVRPQVSANIGASARVMKNFGFRELVLVDAQCEVDIDARRLAKNAQDVLEGAKMVKSIPDYDLRIATTAQLGSEYNLRRTPLAPRELAVLIAARKGTSALLFGPEDAGLSNEEIAACDLLVTIPASTDYPTLNLSHSIAILLYELSLALHEHTERFPLASREQRSKVDELIDEFLARTEWGTDERRETQRRLWHNLLGRSMLTGREAQVLLGFLKKLNGRR